MHWNWIFILSAYNLCEYLMLVSTRECFCYLSVACYCYFTLFFFFFSAFSRSLFACSISYDHFRIHAHIYHSNNINAFCGKRDGIVFSRLLRRTKTKLSSIVRCLKLRRKMPRIRVSGLRVNEFSLNSSIKRPKSILLHFHITKICIFCWRTLDYITPKLYNAKFQC